MIYRSVSQNKRNFLRRRSAVAAATLFAACCCVAADAAEESHEPKEASPPTHVEAWDLKQDLAKIDQQWASIFAILENAEYFAIQRDEVSAWSCGRQAGHLALVLNTTADTIEGLLADPEQNADGQVGAIGKALLTSGLIPRGVGQATADVRPENTSREALLKTLKDAKKKWKDIARKADALKACPARSEHPTGMLSSTEWVRLMAVHNAHHLKIVRDILKASDATGEYGRELGDAGEST